MRNVTWWSFIVLVALVLQQPRSAASQNTTFRLPRYFGLKDDQGYYLSYGCNFCNLYFETTSMSALTTFEVLYNTNSTAIIRSRNGNFWVQYPYGDFSTSEQAGVPDPSDKSRQFVIVQTGPTQVKIKSLGSNSAMQAQFLDASDYAVNFPDYMTLFSVSSKQFVSLKPQGSTNWLIPSSSSPSYSNGFRVVYHDEGRVKIQTIQNSRFWRCDNNQKWIWSDSDGSDSFTFPLQYLPVRLSQTAIALQSYLNSAYLLPHGDQVQLQALPGSTYTDPATHFVVGDFLQKRSIINVQYWTALAWVTDVTPLIVGSGTIVNHSNYTADMQVSVTFSRQVSTSVTFTTSTTFKLDTSVSFTAGIPEIVDATGTISVGFENTFESQIGETTEEEVQFQSQYEVHDIGPGKQATVTVKCTQARASIPFTYTAGGTRYDGIQIPSEDQIDGIFEGVSVLDVHADITDGDGSFKGSLPVAYHRIKKKL